MSNSDHSPREHLTQQRQQDDHRHDAMLERAEAEVHQASTSNLDERARSAMTDQRHHTEQTKANMLARSEDEIE